jgi:hypothetical protein
VASLQSPIHESANANLAQRNLTVASPENQNGLISYLPNGAEFYDIENSYQVSDDEQKVWCVSCQGRRHRRGITVRLLSGELVLIGSHCAEKIFDAERVRAAVRRHHDLKRKQRQLNRLDRLEQQLSTIAANFDEWRPHIRVCDEARYCFRQRMPELYKVLQGACREEDGILKILDDFYEFSVPGLRNFREIARFKMVGHRYLEISSGEKTLDQALCVLKSVTDTSLSVRNREKYMGDRLVTAARYLQRIMESVNACNDFWSDRNLNGIAWWVNEARNNRVRYISGTLHVHSRGMVAVSSNHRINVEKPFSITALDKTPLDELWKLLRDPVDSEFE